MKILGVLVLLLSLCGVPLMADPELELEVAMVSRHEWKARPMSGPMEALSLPVEYVIIHDTQTANCSSAASCGEIIRNVQRYQMKVRRWFDIGYNFLVGGDGLAYEARGWDAVGAHTLGWNARSLGIALVGHFDQDDAPALQTDAVQRLIQDGVRLGKIRADFKLLAACQVRHYESPGRLLFKDMTQWSHWWKYSTPGARCSVEEDDETSQGIE